MDKLYIIVPAYNEAKNIGKLIDDWYPVIEEHNEDGTSRLVIINDGSKDNTYEIVQEYAKDRPLLLPLTKPNGGHGPTLLFGYQYAIDNGADYIFQTDSDGQTNPKEFEQFWEARNTYDAVILSITVDTKTQRIKPAKRRPPERQNIFGVSRRVGGRRWRSRCVGGSSNS